VAGALARTRWSAAERTFARRIDAERHLIGVESHMLDGSYIDPSRSRVTVQVWAQQWLEGQVQLKESTRVRYEGLLRGHVLPRWGRVPLAKIGHADVAAWVADLSVSGQSGSSVRQAHRVFSLILALAVRDGRISRNPAEGVRLPRARKAEKRFLTHEQVSALADASGEYRLVVLILAYCGLRYGELAALRVGRVDLLRRRLDIMESVTEVGGRLVTGTPKTHQQRSVPVPRSLVDDLAVQMAGKSPDEYVFTTASGTVLRLMNFRRRCFDRAAVDAGLDGLTPHELRHTAASLAVSAGANVKSVQRMLGRASAAMTLDVYSGLFDDDLDAVAERLDVAAISARVPRARPEPTVTDLSERRATS
jgi:integrase